MGIIFGKKPDLFQEIPKLNTIGNSYSRDSQYDGNYDCNVSSNVLCGENGSKATIHCPCAESQSDYTMDDWEVPDSSLQYTRHLGSGKFGEVWHAKLNGATEVAVKVLKSGIIAPSVIFQELKKLHHEQFVSLIAVYTREETVLIVSEYMVNGSLINYLRSEKGKNLRLPDLIHMAAQIANGMAYLECEGLVHGDLAAKNVLIKEDNIVKIADFGFAKMIEESLNTSLEDGIRLQTKWIAPEAAVLGKLSIKCDVWSYGILLHELITHGQIPYPGMQNYEMIEQLDQGFRMAEPTNRECPDSVYAKMLQCWNTVPEKRPTFEFLFKFFDDFFTLTEQSNM